ncbi:FXYD domain-containing ion transport regulator 6-like isoform X2 [Mixophyes fleayi]|uniref:FXYD domain-containing ion transport regulator 6-like isoform X2 n=1 Tax=Mixophyes fleayi TaxID=3061075 RepID=UPI003F4DA0EB
MDCKGVQLCLVILSAILSTGRAEDYDRFYYDYRTLRICGLVFAGAMLTLGIIVMLTDLSLFKKKQKAATEARSEV